MKKTNYQDPRWQKKRLEILSRDGFACQRCSGTKETLHVHHTCYGKGREIWEYPDYQLITLCENCHRQEHDYVCGPLSEISDMIGVAKECGLLIDDIASLFDTIIPAFKDRADFMVMLSEIKSRCAGELGSSNIGRKLYDRDSL